MKPSKQFELCKTQKRKSSVCHSVRKWIIKGSEANIRFYCTLLHWSSVSLKNLNNLNLTNDTTLLSLTLSLNSCLPEELSSWGSDLDHPTGQTISLHHGGHWGQAVSFHQSTGDAGGSAALPRGDDDPQTVVSTPSHGSSTSVHHEADQKTAHGHNVQIILKRDPWSEMKLLHTHTKTPLCLQMYGSMFT